MDHDQNESEQIQEFINMINSGHKAVQFEGLVGIRKLTSEEVCPELIDSEILPKLLEMMTWENESRFQIESTWCVLNISAWEAELSDCLIELGGLDIVINLLDSPLEEIVENALWTISNFAGGSLEQRETCLQKDCLNKLLQALKKFPNSDIIIESTLSGIANLYRGDLRPLNGKLLLALPVLYKYISEVYSQETLRNALWSLSYLTNETTQEVIDQGCVPFIIHHLCDGEEKIFAAAMRTAGNLAAGTPEQANELLKFPEFLPRIFELVSNRKENIRREALWIISNLTAGSPEQIEMIINNEKYISILKTSLVTGLHYSANEAMVAILNLFLYEATASQIIRLIEKNNILESFSLFLTKFPDDVKLTALKALLKILKAGESNSGTNSFIKHTREAGLVDIMRNIPKDSCLRTNADLILKYYPEESGIQTEN